MSTRYDLPVTIGSPLDKQVLNALFLSSVTPPANGGYGNFTYNYNINVEVDGSVVYNINNLNVTSPIVLNLTEGYHKVKISGTSSVNAERQYYDTENCMFVNTNIYDSYTRFHDWSDEWWIGSESKTVYIGYTLDNATSCPTSPFSFPSVCKSL